MEIQALHSKLHCVTITQAELDCTRSIKIDANLMDAAHLIENEQVQVLDKNNKERFITYVIKVNRGIGVICLNDPAALRIKLGDVIIARSYAAMNFETAKTFLPWVIFSDTATNTLRQYGK
jgi:aspartate 1-decarboxylase